MPRLTLDLLLFMVWPWLLLWQILWLQKMFWLLNCLWVFLTNYTWRWDRSFFLWNFRFFFSARGLSLSDYGLSRFILVASFIYILIEETICALSLWPLKIGGARLLVLACVLPVHFALPIIWSSFLCGDFFRTCALFVAGLECLLVAIFF